MPRTFLGQNFLIDENWQKKIISHFSPSGDFMEIGPGRGAITQHLCNKFSHFYVYEKDAELVKIHSANSKLTVFNGDFLDWDFSIEGRVVENFSFIGNLPYESGSAMVQKICERADQVSSFLFLLQKEVVERICAEPRTSDFASFTVLVQGQFDVRSLDIIPPEAFRPAPQVMSQLVLGVRRQSGRHPIDVDYQKFLKRSFLHKRKTARNAWKSLMDQNTMERVFDKFKLSSTARAEEISVDLWPEIFREYRS